MPFTVFVEKTLKTPATGGFSGSYTRVELVNEVAKLTPQILSVSSLPTSVTAFQRFTSSAVWLRPRPPPIYVLIWRPAGRLLPHQARNALGEIFSTKIIVSP